MLYKYTTYIYKYKLIYDKYIIHIKYNLKTEQNYIWMW